MKKYQIKFEASSTDKIYIVGEYERSMNSERIFDVNKFKTFEEAKIFADELNEEFEKCKKYNEEVEE